MENTRIRVSLVLCLLLMSGGTAYPLHLEGSIDAAAGGGYENNLNNAASGQQKEGSGFATSRIALTVWKDVFEKGRLLLSGGYEGIYYPSITDLSVNGFTIWGGFRYSITDSIVLGAEPLAGLRSYGENDRDATVYGISLALKDQYNARLAAILGYQFTRNAAKESVFDHDTNQLSIEGEAKIIPGGALIVGYALEFSEGNIYRPAGALTPPGAHDRRTSATFGPNQEVFKADTRMHRFSLDWEQDVHNGFYLLIQYIFSHVQSDPGNYRSHRGSGTLGYRF